MSASPPPLHRRHRERRRLIRRWCCCRSSGASRFTEDASLEPFGGAFNFSASVVPGRVCPRGSLSTHNEAPLIPIGNQVLGEFFGSTVGCRIFPPSGVDLAAYAGAEAR